MTEMDGMTAATELVTVPRPTSIVLGGEELPLTYDDGIFDSEVNARLQDLAQLDRILASEGFDVFREAGISNLKLAGEEFRWMSIHPRDLEYRYNERKKEAARKQVLKGYRERLAACQQQINALPRLVRNYNHLDRAVIAIKHEMEMQGPLYTWRAFDSSNLASSLNELEHKLEWLTEEHNVLALALELAAGRLKVPGVGFNQSVIDQLQSLQIRSDGMIEAPDEDAMFRFYLARLRGDGGCDSIAPAEVYSLDLALHFEDYAPADILEEIKPELLPVVMTIEGKEYFIEYRYIMGSKGREDEWVASGVIEVPLSLYRRLAPAYGKASGFPEMPGGVDRFLRIMKQGEYFTAGFDNVELAAKVEKMEKGRKRLADAPSLEGPTAPPPWYQGKGRAGRRR